MRLHNSLTKRVAELKPLKPGRIGLYTCGPTVYDHVHIGNLRTYIFEDTLRRVLKLSGYKVKHVMNITDVDDKTIAKSLQQYASEEPLAGLKKLTKQYEDIFYQDVAKVGIDFTDSKIVRATAEIPAMQQLITAIPNKYVTDDGVYFDIAKYPAYGVFESLDQSHTHHRINNDEYDKEHVADFALWKAKKAGEPAWDFEVEGQNLPGRPGWHIECSAMSTKHLAQPFDIHTGGVDLKFPHHENEIAQSKSVNGKDLAKVFVHGEHLLVDGKKMAKSAKNFYTLADVEAKGFDPMAFRLLVLQAHYRSQLNFTWESLSAAEATLKNIQDNFSWVYQSGVIADHPYPRLKGIFNELEQKIKKYLLSDLGTPAALAELNEYADMFATIPASQLDIDVVESLSEFIKENLGIEILDKQRYSLPKELERLKKRRDAARNSRNWSEADKLRDELKSHGLDLLKDTDHGSIWYRLPTKP